MEFPGPQGISRKVRVKQSQYRDNLGREIGRIPSATPELIRDGVAGAVEDTLPLIEESIHLLLSCWLVVVTSCIVIDLRVVLWLCLFIVSCVLLLACLSVVVVYVLLNMCWLA